MSSTPFRISGITWGTLESAPPTEVVLDLPSWLRDLGEEDFEPEADDPENDNQDQSAEQWEDDENEDEFDWENYEPSEEACAAFEAEWDTVIRDLLQAKFGHPILNIGRYEPK